MKLNHIMVDLETLGTVPGCVGFSIGAVEMLMEERTLGREFYTTICVESSKEAYLREDEDTRAFWNRQSEEARTALLEAESGNAPKLAEAMVAFNKWLLKIGGIRSIRLYGNGADFDNPILRCMWDAAGVLPFDSKAGFFGGRCYRTLKTLDELLGPDFAFSKLERSGTYHNALDDAKSQAVHMMDNIATIKEALQ